MFLAALLMSMNHNVAPDNRIPSLIIVGLFAIGCGLLSLSHKPKIKKQINQSNSNKVEGTE